MRSPETSNIPRLPPVSVSEYDPNGARRRRLETRAFHDHPVARAIAKMALGASIIATPIAQYWSHDVVPAQYEIAQAGSKINEIYLANNPENNDTAVVDFAGLGNFTSERYVESLDYAEMGRGWAVQYNNGGIDTTVLAKDIIEKAEQSGVDRLVLVGHSMGGIVAAEIAQIIYEQTGIQLDAVVLDGSPLDIDCVRPESREKGMELNRWIGKIPGARYSRIMRGLVEVVARKDEFVSGYEDGSPDIDWSELGETISEVRVQKLTPHAASTKLIEAQFNMILGSGAIDNLASLSKSQNGKIKPKIIFIRPQNSKDDHVVNVSKTEDILLRTLPDQTTILRGVGIQHANPVQRPAEYRPLLEQVVALALPAKSLDSLPVPK